MSSPVAIARIARIGRAAAVIGAIVVTAQLAACGGRRDPDDRKQLAHDARVRRVIEPSTDRFGPLPPYAIRADGIGPYKLGDKLSDLLERLASGPRIDLFEIPGVVHRNVIRAEDDAILIGGEQASTASFVAVVGSEVARTESGIHVGSTRDEVVAALGPSIDDPERARDPRLLAPGAAPNLRLVLDAGRVVAIVVATGAPSPARHSFECQRPVPPNGSDRSDAGDASDTTDGAHAAAKPGAPPRDPPPPTGACLTAAGELIDVGSDDVVVRSADGERQLAPPLRLPGLVFAAALRNAADARDELVAVTRSDDATARTWWLSVYRLEGARLVRSIEASQLYQLSVANARWIGADLRDVELYLELTSRPDAIEVGGLLTTLGASRTTKIRDAIVISPASVRRRSKPAALEPGNATPATSTPSGHVISDAASDASDSTNAESEGSRQ